MPCAVFRPSAGTALQIEDQRHDLLLRAEIELAGLLDGVDGIAAGIGEPDDLGPRRLRL